MPAIFEGNRFVARALPCLASCAVVLGMLAGDPAPAFANEGKAGGGNTCPWLQAITLNIGGKTLTIEQSAFAGRAEPQMVDGYQIFPLVDQLKLRIVSPRGEEWEAGLTRLTGGKRCNVFYAGKPIQVSDSESNAGSVTVMR